MYLRREMFHDPRVVWEVRFTWDVYSKTKVSVTISLEVSKSTAQDYLTTLVRQCSR